MTIARLAWIAVTLGAVGCAENNGPVIGPSSQNTFAGTPVLVENTTTSTLRVYALARGAELPLGRVDALGQRTMHLPYGIGSSVRLVARPAAIMDDMRRHVSEPIALMQNGRITWVLRASPGVSTVPRLSTVRVFRCAGEAEC